MDLLCHTAHQTVTTIQISSQSVDVAFMSSCPLYIQVKIICNIHSCEIEINTIYRQ
jgi:hypothetical protein